MNKRVGKSRIVRLRRTSCAAKVHYQASKGGSFAPPLPALDPPLVMVLVEHLYYSFFNALVAAGLHNHACNLGHPPTYVIMIAQAIQTIHFPKKGMTISSYVMQAV